MQSAKYIHDEWCGSEMDWGDKTKECDCVVRRLVEKDEEIAALREALGRIKAIRNWAGRWYVGEDFNELEGTAMERLTLCCEIAEEATDAE